MAQPTAVLDEETVQTIITAPPFVQVQGVPNLRDVGYYTASENAIVKPAYLYRSADPSHITEKGKEQLRILGIKKVFDLRAPNEVRNFKAPSPMVDGVEFVNVSVAKTEEFEADSLAKELQMFAADEAAAFRFTYKRSLDTGGIAFGAIFKHIRDHPEEPCLVHCTAGKDRTGVFSALYLSLLGVSEEDIVKDYTLTTYGLVPAIPALTLRLKSQKVFQDNWDGAANLGKSSPQTMSDFLKTLREQFGGAEEYLKTHAGLTDSDIALIRQSAVVPMQ